MLSNEEIINIRDRWMQEPQTFNDRDGQTLGYAKMLLEENDRKLNQIFLIKKLWTSPFENDYWKAHGYEAVGFVTTEEEAKKIVKEGGYHIGTGWPFGTGEAIDIFEFEAVKTFMPGDQS